MKQFAKKSLVLFIVLFFTATLSAKTPKYIFYCIGDGMSFAHVMATQLFYENGNYEDGNESLVFLDFPVRSAIRTHANNSLITCSAAAGTALATGHKTNLTHIGIGPDKQPLTSVAKQLRDKGYAIGIITSGQLDDATPAAFYAGQMRNDTYQIGKEGADSQFDFLAGSTLMKPFNRRDPSQPYIYDYYRQKGYTVCRGTEGYNSQKNADKILLVDTDTTLKKWLPYVIEREPGKLGLEFMVQAGIEKLYKKKNKKMYDTVMTLGIIQWISPIEESNDPYYLSIRQGVEEYCFKNKIAIKRVFKTDIDYLNQLEDIQGLVCIGKYSQEDIETYKKICSNVIFLDMNIDPIHECCILLDFKNAVKDVVSYLSQKHTSIAYLGGKEIIHDKLYHDQRKEYFEHYCKEYNIDYSMSEEEFSIESGFNMTYELIKNKKLPSAIFAASDPIAIGAMRALKQYNIKIPEDVSIIGFDNIETTNYTDPPLTTVFAPTFDMGFMAARQLFDAFKHNENISPIKILLPCFLIERDSCI